MLNIDAYAAIFKSACGYFLNVQKKYRAFTRESQK